MPTIVHFEIPADDLGRARQFYSDLFGWKIEKVPGPMEYWLVETADDQGEPSVGGGMMQRQAPEQAITNYIGVPSVDKYAAKVEQIGGKVVVPKTPVPGHGHFAVCLDSENNAFAIWEDDESAAPDTEGGSLP